MNTIGLALLLFEEEKDSPKGNGGYHWVTKAAAGGVYVS